MTSTTIGKWIKQRRKSLDLTQEEFARHVGYSISTIRKIESGDLRPSVEIAKRMATILELDETELPTFLQLARGVVEFGESPLIQSTGSAAPIPYTAVPLMGRGDTLKTIKHHLFRRTTKILTLLGPPGIGKTRLGIQTALEARASGMNVYFFSLERLSQPELLIATIAKNLNITERFDDLELIEAIRRSLGQSDTLFVLDTFEHLTAAEGQLATLLKRCHGLKLLITSRRALNSSFETTITIPPLTITAPDALDSTTNHGATAFFELYARLYQPTFAITPENRPAVIAICQRLEGIPLAIELVASRIKILSPAMMVERLDTLLSGIQNKQHDRSIRHINLYTAIEWSYHLLAPEAQQLFRRISIFSGTFTQRMLNALETADTPEANALLPLVKNLEDHCLIQAHYDAAEPRYEMLAIIREYARHQLQQSGEQPHIEAHYAAYVHGLAKEAAAHFRSPLEGQWLAKLEEQHDHIRAVLDWSLKHQRYDIALGIAGTIWRFWMLRGYIREGRDWLTKALANNPAVDPTIHAQALHAAGSLAALSGNYHDAQMYYQACLMGWDRLNNTSGIAVVLLNLSEIASIQARYSDAERMVAEALELYSSLDDQTGIAMTKVEFGTLARRQGHYAVAEQFYRDALSIQQQLGNHAAIANVTSMLGWIALEREMYAEAQTCFHEAIQHQRHVGDNLHQVKSLDGLGRALLAQGRRIEAKDAWKECLNLAIALDQPGELICAFEGIAWLASDMGHDVHATTLWSLADRLRKARNTPLSPSRQTLYETRYHHSLTRLGKTAWYATWQEGALMSQEQAIAVAQEIIATVA